MTRRPALSVSFAITLLADLSVAPRTPRPSYHGSALPAGSATPAAGETASRREAQASLPDAFPAGRAQRT